MKLRVLSDLHLEFGKLPPLDSAGEDVLVLAGDTGVGLQPRAWLERTSAAVPGRHIVMVAGNHEFYGGWFQGPAAFAGSARKGQDMASVIARWRNVAGEVENFHFLEDDSVVIHGVRFLGGVLWTDFDLYGDPKQAMSLGHQSMNDFRLIAFDSRTRFTPELAADVHTKTRRWLEVQLDVPFEGPTVVVTHHCPSVLSGRKYFERMGIDSDPLAPCFLSNLEHLAERADLWLHGHTHESYDYRIGKCRVVCNPRGYAGVQENPEFDPGKAVEV